MCQVDRISKKIINFDNFIKQHRQSPTGLIRQKTSIPDPDFFPDEFDQWVL